MTLFTHYVMVKVETMRTEDREEVLDFVRGSLEIGMGPKPEKVMVMRATEDEWRSAMGPAGRRAAAGKRRKA